MSDAPRFLAITGPTCSRKTDLSIEVADRLSGEVVSMDSRQIYRGMDIGTDKVMDPARARVPHHGLDLLNPDRAYSAGQFARDARRWIQEIRSRGNVPILAGGTGFFLKSVLDPIFAEPKLDPDRRRRLRGWLEALPIEVLKDWVGALDPERALIAEAGGQQRLVRTLEVPLLTGRPLSWWHENAPPDAPAVPGLVVVLDLPREELYSRINARVLTMVERGLVREVQGLLDSGFKRDDPGMTGTGYREVADYLAGTVTLPEALDAMQRATRRYARRQLTWFRHQLPEDRVILDARRPRAELVSEVASAWRRACGVEAAES